jgi:NAD(P)-dependent dehydrogenase (short-subunit alcohol dehydrogenase family)
MRPVPPLARPRLTISAQDMGLEDDCIQTVKKAIALLGGLDIIISNAVSLAFLYRLTIQLITCPGLYPLL